MQKSLFSRDYGVLTAALRDTREKVGLTQTEVATRLGETQSFVSKCERGERRLDVIELRAWCHALRAPFVEFVQALDKRLSTRR